MKSSEIKADFIKLSAQELKMKVEALKKELFSHRLNASTAHVKDYSQFRKLRKDVARARTYLRQIELS